MTLLTHRSYSTMGYKPGQEIGARAPPPALFLSLCCMKSSCLVLEVSQAVYRQRGMEEGKRNDLRSFELSYQNLISLPLEKENKHRRTNIKEHFAANSFLSNQDNTRGIDWL